MHYSTAVSYFVQQAKYRKQTYFTLLTPYKCAIQTKKRQLIPEGICIFYITTWDLDHLGTVNKIVSWVPYTAQAIQI